MPTTMTPAARRVLDAASRLFYAQGIHAVGVDTIAAEAGVTKKTLYDRFGSKDALVVAYLRERDDRWRELLADHRQRAGTDRERLLSLFTAAERWSRKAGGRGCAAINARAEIDDPEHPIAIEVAREKAWLLEQLVADCRSAGADRPKELAAELALLYDGALAASGLHSVRNPFGSARRAAEALCTAHGI
ncbi:TetR/AcrR family transcriptional regulator [Naumannella halotolerans]|nr:TetR/AcrR family transcriptional regulator [Naumannella halotolerans]